MEIEVLRRFLRSKEFIIYKELYTGVLFHQFAEAGMDIWLDSNRVVVTKHYISESQFDCWIENEQPRMFMLLNHIPVRYRNNLYLFMALDIEEKNLGKLSMKINRIEKNAEVCKKYVFRDESDLYRIPFLNKDTVESEDLFNYEKSFKQELNNLDDISLEVRQAIGSYFEISEDTWAKHIVSVWKEGEVIENK
ncbi:ABC-three component system middle component 1 [Candidatus Clostridium radicumherbarum]|uniref:ABC-three component system middle component 1 n=1 Tax=Candidatus Clostridium radicumherbarum TaxID=3381662 RepID=A0ABW8U088_9CLOT